MTQTQREIEASLGLGPVRRRFPLWLAGLGGAVLIGGGAIWAMQRDGAGGAIRYTTDSARRGDLTVIVTATGTIEPTNQVAISSELSGTIAEVLVDYNDSVTAGQVLARLDAVQLGAQVAVQTAAHAAAIAQLASARASFSEAETTCQITRQLDARGVTSQTALTTSEAGLARAEAGVASAQANVDLAAAQLAAQQAILAKATILSPINGIVLDRAVDAGQIVAASLAAPELFTIAEDLTQMELQVDVAESDIGRISVGDSAAFTVDAYDDTPFPAKISMVRYASDNTEGLVTYKAILSVENEQMLLRPGMTATADVTVAQHEAVLLVPNAALRFSPPQEIAVEEEAASGGGLLGLIMPSRPKTQSGQAALGGSVWVLRGDLPTEIAVKKGDSDGISTVILGGDLAAGDLLILDQTGGA